MGLCPALQCVMSNPSRCRDARRSPARRTMSAANNVDVKRMSHAYTRTCNPRTSIRSRTEINAAFPDPVCRSCFGLRHQENDHVDQDCSGSRVRVRRYPGRTGVCRSPDLRVQHVSIRQLRRHRWSLLSLSDAAQRRTVGWWPAPRRPSSRSLNPPVCHWLLDRLCFCSMPARRPLLSVRSNRSEAVGQSASSSSNILACFKSSVSRPSVNQP